MAKQFNNKDQFNHELVNLGEFLEAHFGLTELEVDQILYSPVSSTVEDLLEALAGYPEYRNYN